MPQLGGFFWGGGDARLSIFRRINRFRTKLLLAYENTRVDHSLTLVRLFSIQPADNALWLRSC